MSSEDWDLFAVVRSCSSSVSTTNSCAGHEDNRGNCKQEQDPSPPPPPLFTHIHKDRDNREPSSSSSCNELQDSCKPFLPATTTTTWSPPPLLPPPTVSSPSPKILMKQEQVLHESQDQKPPLSVRVFPPSTSSSSSVFVFRGQRDQLLQQQSQPPLRSRKRKNQQKRTICHVTQENLSSDLWAWRKYGQKPIKGSPYPRNYYRCSSSKGCPARKQVERSRVDPSKLMITYACDHNHPFPSSSANNKSHHRSSVVLKTAKKEEEYEEEEEELTVTAAEEPPAGLDLSHVDSPLLLGGCYSEIGEFGWFYDASISSSSGSSNFLDVTLERGLSLGQEEDESLFGDLGDLPDCASVFRRGTVATEEQHRRCDFGAIPFCDSSR